MKGNIVRTSIKIPESLHKKIKFKVIEDRITLNELVNKALEEYFKKKEEENANCKDMSTV